MPRRYRTEEKEFSEINITPLTDVMLVLLLIFMITSPVLLTGALKIKLPAAASSESRSDPQKSLTVSLNAQNEIYLNSERVTFETLSDLLKQQLSAQPDPVVVFEADKTLPYGDIVKVLDVIKHTGATKLVISAQKQSKTP